jgi:hypothetical protein
MSGIDFVDGDSAGPDIPKPALSCVAAAFEEEVRSGKLTVGVVGDGTGFSERVKEGEGFNAAALSESPRAGSSTRE